MNKVIISLVDAYGNSITAYPNKLVIKRDSSAADILSLEILGNFPLNDLRKISCNVNGKLIFSGIVDEEISLLSSDGRGLKLICRDLTALIIDNHLMAGTIKSPSLKGLWAAYLKPLGFSIFGEDFKDNTPLDIGENTSIITMLKAFCSRNFSAIPYVDENGVIYPRGRNGKKINVSDIIESQTNRNYYKVISEYFIKNSVSGIYSARLENPKALGIERRRFLTNNKNPEFSKYISRRLMCIGYIDAYPGDTAYEGEIGLGLIDSVKYTFDSSGEKTQLTIIED